ncbi:hypothetical protein CERZMDRAFT_85559 [Cercospora zeae-maydis SCOH1-5]|uniref:WSC domain-containing protein n=1 Tax=Cercospora zeae-maydis SCOH1-5 TaxID=717836 RepID=A0A6A6FDU1_9PEZI|nr:hypothetical protein CERZMDRAFT_85559 [Cercospora zeae-maydis SCOH1-5]
MSARTTRMLLCALAMIFAMVVAQDTSIVYPTTAGTSATPLPSADGYAYAGCWNETIDVAGSGGVRALSEVGNFTANNSMTIGSCLKFCQSANAQYAGLEYGRECYCSPYLSTFSDRLDDSNCSFACNGNSSEICGGRLAITLYNRTEGSTGMAWRVGSGSQATWYGFLAFVFMVFAAFL